MLINNTFVNINKVLKISIETNGMYEEDRVYMNEDSYISSRKFTITTKNKDEIICREYMKILNTELKEIETQKQTLDDYLDHLNAVFEFMQNYKDIIENIPGYTLNELDKNKHKELLSALSKEYYDDALLLLEENINFNGNEINYRLLNLIYTNIQNSKNLNFWSNGNSNQNIIDKAILYNIILVVVENVYSFFEKKYTSNKNLLQNRDMLLNKAKQELECELEEGTYCIKDAIEPYLREYCDLCIVDDVQKMIDEMNNRDIDTALYNYACSIGLFRCVSLNIYRFSAVIYFDDGHQDVVFLEEIQDTIENIIDESKYKILLANKYLTGSCL